MSDGPESGLRTNLASVIKVRREGSPREAKAPCFAKRSDSIWLDVLDLDQWLADPTLQKRLPADRGARRGERKLIPLLLGGGRLCCADAVG